MDLTSLLDPIDPEAPSGPDLEYDAAFLALERVLENAYADRAVGPESEEASPDWRQIADGALTLLGRSRDLRVAVTLTKAWLNLQGVPGLARGLWLLRNMLSEHWTSVHPQLGAEGDHDGVMRANALRSLCDARSVISALRSAPLVKAAGLGEFSLRDFEKVQSGTQSGAAAVDAGPMEAAWTACPLEQLEATHQAVHAARADLGALEAAFAERGAATLRLSELAVPLDFMHSLLTPRLNSRRAAATEAQRLASAADSGSQASLANQVNHAAPPVRSNADTFSADGAPLSRAEIARQLDRMCAYYAEHEPSSPVPLLLRRAKRLTTMQFVDIVRELAPGGMGEIDTLRGPNTTEES
jgi:type VI secretion system protein ImpA